MNLTRYRRPSQDGIFYPSNSLSVLSRLLLHRYDIIHLHIGGRIWPRQLALALLIAALPGTKSVLTFHSGGYPSSLDGLSAHARTLRAFVFRRFRCIIAVNQEIAAFFRRLGVPESRIRLVCPYIPIGSTSRNESSFAKPISEFVVSHHPLLISVGLLEPEYDFPLQMQVLGGIRQRHPESGLLIVGSGSLDESLRKNASSFPYANHILFSGDLEHSLTLAAIARSDVMLRTTWYDGDAMSVREALELGVPVIASDNGMRPPGVKLIPRRNLQALERAIEEVLAGQRKSPVAPSFGGSEPVDEVLAIFRQLLGSY
jgi:glycosyltransferase involved in cell wall biosynthesis